MSQLLNGATPRAEDPPAGKPTSVRVRRRAGEFCIPYVRLNLCAILSMGPSVSEPARNPSRQKTAEELTVYIHVASESVFHTLSLRQLMQTQKHLHLYMKL